MKDASGTEYCPTCTQDRTAQAEREQFKAAFDRSVRDCLAAQVATELLNDVAGFEAEVERRKAVYLHTQVSDTEGRP